MPTALTPAEAIRRIDGLEKFGIHLGLDRIAECLRRLGNPQSRFAAVHVAGTNGKGSTAAFTASILERAGYRVGLYTSPPLESFGERIRVDGADLPDEAVPELLARVEATGVELTQFEVITAMAFVHFAERGVELAVVEVGLGGRLDATNVVEPAVSAVTNVGLDHVEHLGPTLGHIAREKAAIARPGVPLVTAAEGEALEVVVAEAGARGAPVVVVGRDVFVEPEGEDFGYRGRRWRLTGLRPSLRGPHQRWNLAVAVAMAECLAERGWRVSPEAVARGVAAARWPGRFEVLGQGPRVVLDGAHNPHASRWLAETLRGEPKNRLLLVLGVLGDKDAQRIVADLAPLADRVWVTRSASARAIPPERLLREARSLVGDRALAAATVPKALDQALAEAGPGDLVCVTGSLTVVGEARRRLRELGWVS